MRPSLAPHTGSNTSDVHSQPSLQAEVKFVRSELCRNNDVCVCTRVHDIRTYIHACTSMYALCI